MTLAGYLNVQDEQKKSSFKDAELSYLEYCYPWFPREVILEACNHFHNDRLKVIIYLQLKTDANYSVHDAREF